MWVAAAHLALEPIGHVDGGKLTVLFADHDLKGHVQQDVTQLGTDRLRLWQKSR